MNASIETRQELIGFRPSKPGVTGPTPVSPTNSTQAEANPNRLCFSQSQPTAATPYQPVTVAEAMEAIHELIMSEYGSALPTFDKTRHTRARLHALDLEERYLIAGGAL